MAVDGGRALVTLAGRSDTELEQLVLVCRLAVPGQWAFDTVQVARFGCDQFKVKSVSIEADNDFGWSSLGEAQPNRTIATGNVRIGRESRRTTSAPEATALADVPGVIRALDIQHSQTLARASDRAAQKVMLILQNVKLPG